MRQLAPLDAVFVSLETPDSPTHIGGLTLLDPSTSPEFGFERLREIVGSRLALSPRFGWKLREVPFGLDLPYWVDHERFDLDDHVRRIAVPSPGGMNELTELAGYLFSQPLDRNRPLWEVWFIEGVEGGRTALVMKMHHCLMDGVSGAGLAELLCDLQPEPTEAPLLPVDSKERAGPGPAWSDIARRGIDNALERPRHLARHLKSFAAKAVDSLRDPADLPMPSRVPRASFNGRIGRRRALACAEVSFDAIKSVKKHFDVTVNDVVLAVTGGALRRVLTECDELPGASLVALVPMSTRAQGDVKLGNQITECAVSWATDVADPAERLRRIHASAERAKDATRSTGANLMKACGEVLPPGLFNLMYRAAQSASELPMPGNAVVSNVRGTPVPLYIAGARVEGMYPMSILAPTQGLNITVVSYCGRVFFGFTVDPDLVPEPWRIADAIAPALAELEAAAEARVRQAG
ncbi:MAG: wax ester/triacylglycerol synthase family O-acyltransferase [Myxococcota bacterium]|nr:wax ester/triacylglycerol synthase family O-acyltransferase [Myxococcota bacterium]